MPSISPLPASPESERPPRSGASDERKGEAGQRATGLAPPAYLHPWPPLPSICWPHALRPPLGHGSCQNPRTPRGIASRWCADNLLPVSELHDSVGATRREAERSFDAVPTVAEAPGGAGRVTSIPDVKCETVEVSTRCRNLDGLCGSGSAARTAAPLNRCRTSSSSRGDRSWRSRGAPRPAACSTRSGSALRGCGSSRASRPRP